MSGLLTALASILPSAAAGGIAIVQNLQSTAGTGTSRTLSISPSAGNRLVIAVATDAVSFTVTDDQSSVYTATPSNSVFGTTVGMAVSASLASGVTTVTVTPLASAFIQIIGYEVSGLTSGYSGGDAATSFFAGDPTWDSGSFTNGTAASIVFYLASCGGTGSDSTTFGTYTNGFASYGANASYPTGSTALATVTSYKIVSSAATQSTKVTPSATGNGVNVIAAFH